MTDIPSIQWFPGHMQKARRLVEENLRSVDVVAELRDARVPLASANPLLQKILGKKPRVIVLTKADLADETATARIVAALTIKERAATIAVDVKSGMGLKKLTAALKAATAKKAERFKSAANGAKTVAPPVRVMIVGIPNVGKSSLINKLAGASKANVENRPGVTRAKQWIKAGKGLELLDMPGVLWPKFDDKQAGVKLALVGAVRDEIYDNTALALLLLEKLKNSDVYGKMLTKRFDLELLPEDVRELLRIIGKKRGCLAKGGDIDEDKTAVMLLKEFRGGKLGRITLDRAEDEKNDD